PRTEPSTLSLHDALRSSSVIFLGAGLASGPKMDSQAAAKITRASAAAAVTRVRVRMDVPSRTPWDAGAVPARLAGAAGGGGPRRDRKSTRLNSSHVKSS